MWKNVHKVSGAGIRTHDLLIMSLLLQPLQMLKFGLDFLLSYVFESRCV